MEHGEWTLRPSRRTLPPLAIFALLIATATTFAASRPEVTPRIIGGTNAKRGDWPAITAILYADEPDAFFAQFCAGTLVHPQWVVTAAHCVAGMIPPEIEAAVGAYDLDDPGERIEVVDIIIHPDFDPITLEADIALLLLARAVAHPPVDLSADDTIQAAPGTMATILGWGDITNGQGIYPTILQEAAVPIISNQTANQPHVHAGRVTSRMVAAGYAAGQIDTCPGDSGGPLLVASTEPGRWLLAGVTSWGYGCGDPNSYGVYTRASSFRPWLRDLIHPGYGAWEEASGVALPVEDATGDGTSALLAYALAAEPGQPIGVRLPHTGTMTMGGRTYPTVTVPRWRGDPTVTWWVEESQNLHDWQSVHPDQRLLGDPEPLDAFRETVTFRGDLALEDHPHAHLRLRPRLNDSFVAGAIRWTGPSHMHAHLHRLLPSDPTRPGAVYRFREFLVGGLPPGIPIHLTTRAREFTTHLRIENLITGQTVPTESLPSNAQTDLHVRFTPEAGQSYRILASTVDAGSEGPIRVALFDPILDAPVSRGSTVAGSLSTGSSYHAELGDSTFYYNLHKLTWTGDPAAVVAVTARSSQFDAYVEILDPETFATLWMDDDNGGGTDAKVRFPGEHPAGYLLLVSSAIPNQTGSYTVEFATDSLPTLAANNSFTTFTLSTSSRHDPDRYATTFVEHYIDERLLANLPAGTVVEIDLESVSHSMDPYLFVFDAHTGEGVVENDDRAPGDFNSRVRFTIRPHTRYLIRSSTYNPTATGQMRVRARTVP